MTTETQILTDEQIAQALNDAGVTEYADVPLRYDLEVARAIEQAVLQSPEMQALRKDAEISRWLRVNGLVGFPAVRDWMTIRVVHPMPLDVATFDEAIGAAMEQKP